MAWRAPAAYKSASSAPASPLRPLARHPPMAWRAPAACKSASSAPASPSRPLARHPPMAWRAPAACKPAPHWSRQSHFVISVPLRPRGGQAPAALWLALTGLSVATVRRGPLSRRGIAPPLTACLASPQASEDLGNFAQVGNKARVRGAELPSNAEFPRSGPGGRGRRRTGRHTALSGLALLPVHGAGPCAGPSTARQRVESPSKCDCRAGVLSRYLPGSCRLSRLAGER
jgi:hypothetical protein